MRGITAILALLFVLVIAPAGFAQDASNVRITNLSPDAGEVSVWINGELVREYLGFRRTTEYFSINPGANEIVIRPAFEETTTLMSYNLATMPNQNYTLGISGLVGANDLEIVYLEDNTETNLRSARMRFVHTTPGVGMIDIAIAGGRVLVERLSYRESSDYIAVRPDVYPLEIRAAGTTEVLYTLEDVGMSRLTACTIFTTTEGEDGLLKTVHTFEANLSINYQEILLGLSLWAVLLAWFVQNHANS